ncbi:2TM domain-containing protein [Candidatus Lokiarchaeum ossiferum]|uniref:2TM domain-containing protein n=1 Tax=Candidatus Lokiarchaeum ossiferum TaxID=2951803 RepID=UPI00352FAC43
MTEEKKLNEFNDDSVRRIAKQMIVRRYVVILHCWVYVFVNILLFIINFLVNHLSYPWFLWALSGWGLGLLIHSFSYWIYTKGVVNIAKLLFYYHLFIFICTNILIAFIDGFTSSPRWTSPWWCLWVVGFWAVGLALHLIIVYYIVPKRGESEDLSWLDRKIDKELERIKTQRKISADERRSE